jgi:hypothetical protein
MSTDGFFKDNTVLRNLKPPILSVFGDIALAIGPEFRRYMEVVLVTLAQASKAQVDTVRSFHLMAFVSMLSCIINLLSERL